MIEKENGSPSCACARVELYKEWLKQQEGGEEKKKDSANIPENPALAFQVQAESVANRKMIINNNRNLFQ